MSNEQIAALAVIDTLKTKRSVEVRDVVGYIDCRCGRVSKVVRGKVKIYESCESCGTKLANGNANTQYILKNMRVTAEKPESLPEKKLEADSVPDPEKPEETPAALPPRTPSFLVQAFQKMLAFELFEL